MSQGITNFGGKLYISTTVQNEDLELAGFQGLSWTELPNVGNIGETGVSQSPTTFSTWGRQVVLKGKGEADAGNPEVTVLDLPSAGMTAFLAAAASNNQDNYAFKIEWSDGSIEYNRGLVMGPRLPKGANSDFKRAVFTLANQQEPVFDDGSSA